MLPADLVQNEKQKTHLHAIISLIQIRVDFTVQDDDGGNPMPPKQGGGGILRGC